MPEASDDFEQDDAFFDVVDALLTPAMTSLGYHRIGEYVDEESSSVSALTRPGPVDEHHVAGANVRWFRFGFEAGTDAVKENVDPADPESADELWLEYEPATGTLDLGSWSEVA